MGKTHAEFAVLLKMLIGYEFVMDSYELVMSACEISMIYLCIFETIYAVLLLRVGRVVVHLCDHNCSKSNLQLFKGVNSIQLLLLPQHATMLVVPLRRLSLQAPTRPKSAVGVRWVARSYTP